MDIKSIASTAKYVPLHAEVLTAAVKKEGQKREVSDSNAETAKKADVSSGADKLKKAVEQANKLSSFFNKHLSYSIDDATEQLVVRVIDNETGETIRQIPPEVMLKLSAYFSEMEESQRVESPVIFSERV